MSMLAAAGIYLVLDVNSPTQGFHLNRYEPWTTYNEEYLENVFKVVEQFSYYNNTLGFFAGNEIVNDITSAKNSPVYVKAVIRDIKQYIDRNSPRPIPVGYSAADDLNYRMPFLQYLECMDQSTMESVDFYGVNSYQWCGEQTFYTSGFNTLVNDYSSYSLPLFFSEYGCNEVLPRGFGEVHTLYSNDMVDVFSGGLVYQYSQEPNNYGLVELASNGDAKLLKDFLTLKSKFDTLPPLDYYHIAKSMKENVRDIDYKKKIQKFAVPPCGTTYDHIDISAGLPKTLAKDLIDRGVNVERGKLVALSQQELTCLYDIKDPEGQPFQIIKTIEPKIDYMSGTPLIPGKKIKYQNGMYDDEDSDILPGSESDSDSEQQNITILGRISNYLSRVFNLIVTKFHNQ